LQRLVGSSILEATARVVRSAAIPAQKAPFFPRENRMFSFEKHLHAWLIPWADILDSGTVERGTTLIASQMPALARRNPVMIMPSIWRRSGPNRNLHDQRGTLPKGARHACQKPRRLGLTFWHRPYRVPSASKAH
jgi:hypothetical protein